MADQKQQTTNLQRHVRALIWVQIIGAAVLAPAALYDGKPVEAIAWACSSAAVYFAWRGA